MHHMATIYTLYSFAISKSKSLEEKSQHSDCHTARCCIVTGNLQRHFFEIRQFINLKIIIASVLGRGG